MARRSGSTAMRRYSVGPISTAPGYRPCCGTRPGRLPRVTRLILIRHAPTADTGKRLTGRLPGVPSAPAGRRAAAALARALGRTPAWRPSTPRRRCAAARPRPCVAEPHGLRPGPTTASPTSTTAPGPAGPWPRLRRTALWRLVHTAPSRVRFPGGEALAAVQARAVAACEALAAAHPEATLAVVTHGDVIAHRPGPLPGHAPRPLPPPQRAPGLGLHRRPARRRPGPCPLAST